MGLFNKIKDLVNKEEDQTAPKEKKEGEAYSPEELDDPPEYTFVKVMHAAAKGNIETVKQYLDFSPHYAQCRDWDDSTLLHRAAHYAWTDILQLLLENGAEVNFPYKEKSPLHLTVGTDADWVKHNKRIEFAEHQKHQLETAKLLVAAGADLNTMDAQGETPLHTAMRMGYLNLAQLLLARGADIDMPTGPGSTANAHTEGRSPLLLVARHSKNKRVIEFLLKKGADPNVTDSDPGYTALHYIAAAPHYPDEKRESVLAAITELLLTHKADPNAKAPRKNNKTPLHLAAANDHVGVADVLIRHGADMLAEDSKQRAAMAIAASSGSLEMMNCLLKHGVDVYKSRAMFYAAHCKNSTAPMQLLLDKGVDINYPDEKGVTPIFAAISANSFQNVKFMLDHGANTKLHPVGYTVTQHAFANWGAVEAMPEEKRKKHTEDARNIIQILGGFD